MRSVVARAAADPPPFCATAPAALRAYASRPSRHDGLDLQLARTPRPRPCRPRPAAARGRGRSGRRSFPSARRASCRPRHVCCSQAPDEAADHDDHEQPHQDRVSPPPNVKPACSTMSGRLSSPSQRWPRIHVCARPSRHTAHLLARSRAARRTPSSPNPAMPYASPGTIPPLGASRRRAYGHVQHRDRDDEDRRAGDRPRRCV